MMDIDVSTTFSLSSLPNKLRQLGNQPRKAKKKYEECKHCATCGISGYPMKPIEI